MSVYEEKYGNDANEDCVLVSKSVSDTVIINVHRTGLSDLVLNPERFKNLRELVISSNLLTSFDALLKTLTSLPGLRLLDASENRWTMDFHADLEATELDLSELGAQLNGTPSTAPHGEPANSAASAPHSATKPSHALETLILNAVPGLTWASVAAFLTAAGLGRLRELGLGRNRLGRVPAADARLLTATETLRLEHNALAGPDDIAGLQHLPALSTLVLSHNPLAGFEYPPPSPLAGAPPPVEVLCGGAAPPQPFGCLRSLYLSGTGLGRWEDIDALARLPALRDVRLQARCAGPRGTTAGGTGVRVDGCAVDAFPLVPRAARARARARTRKRVLSCPV